MTVVFNHLEWLCKIDLVISALQPKGVPPHAEWKGKSSKGAVRRPGLICPPCPPHVCPLSRSHHPSWGSRHAPVPRPLHFLFLLSQMLFLQTLPRVVPYLLQVSTQMPLQCCIYVTWHRVPRELLASTRAWWFSPARNTVWHSSKSCSWEPIITFSGTLAGDC